MVSASVHISRRLERASSQKFDIKTLGNNNYKVHSHKSGNTYDVEISSNVRCSCPDFETNGLGTCKHIETVKLKFNIKKAQNKINYDEFHDNYKELLKEIKNKQKRKRNLSISLKLPLYEYQNKGALFLASMEKAILADDMGLGKTPQAIAASLALRQNIKHALIVCPASLKNQWKNEIEKFSNEKAVVIDGSKDKRKSLFYEESFFKIMNYELLLKNFEDVLKSDFDLIILDEAQRIKNWRAKRTQLIKKLTPKYAFVLTGTPIENKLEELYSITEFLDRRLFGPAWLFMEKHMIKDEWGGIIGYKNIEEIREKINKIMLRRNKKEVLKDLPDCIQNNYYIELTDIQEKLHNNFRSELRKIMNIIKKHIEEDEEVPQKLIFTMLGILHKMRETCDDAYLINEKESSSSKLDELSEIANEIKDNHKFIVFSQWERMTKLIEKRLSGLGIKCVRFHGSLSSKQRNNIINKFISDKNTRAFISTDAGGLGLNLQAADYVINFDLPWNPAVLDQRIGRAHRIGQKSVVNAINLIAENSIEKHVEAMLNSKRELTSAVLDKGSSYTKTDVMEIVKAFEGI